jgi:hypothetical protein
MRTSQKTPGTITTIGIDLGKNTFHLVGFDKRGAIVLQRKVPVVSSNIAFAMCRAA